MERCDRTRSACSTGAGTDCRRAVRSGRRARGRITTVARVQHEIAEETLAALIARRDQLTPALNQVNGAAARGVSKELRVAREALTTASRNIQRIVDGVPCRETHRRRRRRSPTISTRRALDAWADALEQLRCDYDAALEPRADAQRRVNELTVSRDQLQAELQSVLAQIPAVQATVDSTREPDGRAVRRRLEEYPAGA